jgi:5-formyltetrahydrofolate cyclo-ligase
MGIIDIRYVKLELRKRYKNSRLQMSKVDKLAKEFSIFNRIIRLPEYLSCELLVAFVSTDLEVDTKKIILKAIADGKKVAVPKCVDNSREMDFYLITSFDDLEVATFGVLEPIISKCEKVNVFSNSICLVPGLAFDSKGFRLGYGKGYYDRFLENYNGMTIGICYNSCLTSTLPRGRFDKAVEIVITENFTRRLLLKK